MELTEIEINIQNYVSKKVGKKFTDWMLIADRYIIYRELMEAFNHYKDFITIDRQLAHDYARLILSHSQKYGVEIGIAKKTDSFYYLQLTGFKKHMEELDKFCQEIYSKKSKKSLKSS